MRAVGILEFRYGHSKRFREQLAKQGAYSINLGDCIQTIAVSRLLARMGVDAGQVIRVDRDSLPAYSGPPVRLIMNGCFQDHTFPIPAQVEPLFIGFQTSSRRLITDQLHYFKTRQPIGCRDAATAALFREQGIDAYISGCLTLTFSRRTKEPEKPQTIFVGGEGAGELPGRLRGYVPDRIWESAIYMHQREKVTTFPLADPEAARAEQIAGTLLDTYREQATRVVTPLLHVAGPCMSMGIPVILARKYFHDRFTSISHLLPVYTPEYFSRIDWDPDVVETAELKGKLQSLVADALAEKELSTEIRDYLAGVYEGDGGPTGRLRAGGSTESLFQKFRSSTRALFLPGWKSRR